MARWWANRGLLMITILIVEFAVECYLRKRYIYAPLGKAWRTPSFQLPYFAEETVGFVV